jgi:hypothetical protein
MATNLPTLSVSDAQSARILEAFKALFGTTTTAETVKAYKKWLAAQVRTVVVAEEGRRLDAAHEQTKRDALVTLEADLPNPETVV